MKTLVSVSVLVAGCLTPLALARPADAAIEFCDGVAATIVGTPGATITGTDGPDVIVSDGAAKVSGGLGDDLICTTGSVQSPTYPTDPGASPAVTVFGGPGNDVIDRRGDTGAGLSGWVYPEAGQDQVFGSPSADFVQDVDGTPDTISLGDGDDSVSEQNFARSPSAESGTIDLGAGDDEADIGPAFSPSLSVSGGDGEDHLSLYLPPSGRFTVDARAGRLRQGRKAVLPFSGFDDYEAGGLDARTPWSFVGGPGDEHVFGDSRGLRKADLGGGDDTLSFDMYFGWLHDRVALSGGSGRDLLSLRGNKALSIDADLDHKRFTTGLDGPTGRLSGFEDAAVEGSVVDVVGTAKANTLTVASCKVGSVRGLGGGDTLTIHKLTGHAACQETAVRSAYGGGGDDTLTGGPERELLDGGRGHDTADGGPGRDRCPSVESATSC